jgi:hypothetical protein
MKLTWNFLLCGQEQPALFHALLKSSAQSLESLEFVELNIPSEPFGLPDLRCFLTSISQFKNLNRLNILFFPFEKPESLVSILTRMNESKVALDLPNLNHLSVSEPERVVYTGWCNPLLTNLKMIPKLESLEISNFTMNT